MTKVYLKGLGLIGSSLARAIKKEHPDYVLIAEDQDHAAERYALEHGIADECGTAFDKAEDAETLAGLILDIKEDFPKIKEQIDYGRCQFIVLELDKRRIGKVKVIINSSSEE